MATGPTSSSMTTTATTPHVHIKSEPTIVGQNGTTKIKEEPGTGRLTSFRLPRDLTLGGIPKPSAASKKVFTPNLNVVRNKNTNVKTSRDTTAAMGGRGRGRGERGGRAERGGSRGRGRGGQQLVQTSGLFSEGTAEVNHRKSSGFGSRSTEDSPNNMRRPTYVKRELKVDPNTEKNDLKMILGEDDFDDNDDDNDDGLDHGDSSNSSDGLVPIGLSESKSNIKIETDLSGSHATERSMMNYPDNINSLLDRQQPQLLLIQLPDALPGQSFASEPPSNDGPSSTQSTTADSDDSTQSFCTMNKLDEGLVGKIVRYRSGKTKLIFGQTQFDIDIGIEPGLLQEAMAVYSNPNERSGSFINFGQINAKLNATPDWEHMMASASSGPPPP